MTCKRCHPSTQTPILFFEFFLFFFVFCCSKPKLKLSVSVCRYLFGVQYSDYMIFSVLFFLFRCWLEKCSISFGYWPVIVWFDVINWWGKSNFSRIRASLIECGWVAPLYVLFGWSVNSNTNHRTRIEINTRHDFKFIENTMESVFIFSGIFPQSHFISYIGSARVWPVSHENRNSFWQNGPMKPDNLKFNRVNKRFHIRFFYVLFFFNEINNNSVLLFLWFWDHYV